MNNTKRVPVISEKVSWSHDNEGMIVVARENTGVYNRMCQKLFAKPKTTYIHLDLAGTLIWERIDGIKNETELFELTRKRHIITKESMRQYIDILVQWKLVKV